MLSIVPQRVVRAARLSRIAAPFLIGVAVFFTALATTVSATPFTRVSPDGTALPSAYPEAGGVALILYGANGNIYYQFSDPAGAFVGFQQNRNPQGQPARFRGNPFTINDPLLLDCGLQSCSEYFGGQIVRMEVRFTAFDGDTQQGGFDEDDITLEINGTNIGNWSDIPTENTSADGTQLISSQLGFGNRTFDTGWFATNDTALLADILTTESVITQVRDQDPDDNFWNFRLGNSISDPSLERVAPAYTLDKRARTGSFTGPDTATFNAVGDTIFYTYDFRNVGSVRIDDLEVNDDRLGIVACNPSSIEVDETATCQASHVVTQEEFDAQEITNIAIGQGTPAFGQLGTLSDTVTLTGPGRNPGIALEKTPTGGTYAAAGETITYNFVATNTGDVTLSNVAVTDPLIPALDCTQGSLAPGATLTCSFPNTVTQDDVDRGSIVNTADVTAVDPVNDPQQATDTATNTAVQNPAFSVVKSTPSTPSTVGQVLTYNFDVRNDGNVSIRNVTPVDAKCAGPVTLISGDTDGDGELDVTETQRFSCQSQPLLQSEIDAGQVDNDVSVSGDPAGGVLAPATDSLSTPIVRSSGFDVTKSTTTTPVVGQPLTYSFVVTNTGNASISNIVIADAKCQSTPALQSGDADNDGQLDSTETFTYSCTSVNVTQEEIDAGTVENTVTLNGTGADGNPVPQASDTLITPAPQNPAFTVAKSTASVPTQAGDRLDYSFLLTNTGDVTILSPVLSDANCASAITLQSGDTDGDGALDVGEAFTYICQSVPVTQPQVDAGQVVNTVNVTGTPAGGALAPATDTETTPIAPAPALSLDKQLRAGSPSPFSSTNDVLTYDFVVTNTGNITLTDAITIADNDLDAPGASCPALPSGGLAPGGTITCSGQHSVTQQDINNGSFTNTASASSGATTSPDDSVTVQADQNPSFDLLKVATEPLSFTVGQTISYDYTVTNNGNTTIPQSTPITVDDNRTPVTCNPIPAGGLDPTQSLTCTASYQIVQADVDLGTVTNTATATDGTTVSPTAVATVPGNLSPALSLAKEPLRTPGDVTEAGDTITYQYTVQNTGGAAFSAPVTVSDNRINNGAPFTCWSPGDSNNLGANLDPDPIFNADPQNNTNGETAVCTAIYPVTQEDIDAGFVDNEAVANTIFGPGGAQIPVSSAPAIASTPFELPSSLTVAKAADPADLTPVAVGSVVTYTFTLTNTGEVTLNDVVPVDGGPTFGGQAASNALSVFTVTSGVDGNTDGRVDTLAPDAVATVTATYTLTQADIDNAAAAADPATGIANTANATATPATGTLDPVADSTASTGFTPQPAFVATKSTASLPEQADDTLDYTFTVENTGNVTITNLTLDDPKCASGPNFLSGDLNGNGDFDVDEIFQFSCTSIPVTQAEVDAGEVENTVTVSGTPAGGVLADTTADNTTEIPADGSLDVEKSTASTVTAAGQTLLYSFVVTNPGNVSITPGTLADAKCAATPVLQSGDDNGDSAINPTETFTYTCTSIPVTQAEVDAGEVLNSVSVPGTTPAGDPIEPATDSVTTPVTADPNFSVTKATADVPTTEGQLLNYTFTVENDGNVSIGNLILSDAKCQAAPTLQSGDTNNNSRIEPDETFVFGCISIPVTQAEIDAGTVDNTVSVTGNAPDGAALPPAGDTLSTPVNQNPSFELTKTTTSTPQQAGDTLTYTFGLTNTGNTSISSIDIADAKCTAAPLLDPATDVGGDDVLSPAEVWSLSCTSIPVTQAEVDAGAVVNTATATGTPSGGTLAPSTAGNTTDITGTPGVAIAKASTSTPTAAGQTLVYDFTVTNTGNTSLPVVTIADPKCAATPVLISGDANADGALNPTETYLFQCTSIPVTQAEVDAGEVVNTATASATDTLGNAAPEASDSNTTPVPAAAGFTVEKSTTSQPTVDGETLEYFFTVANTGNVSINNIVVSDAKCAAPASLVSGDLNNDGLLDPTETFVFTCTSIPVTQAEIDNGVIDNTVSVAGDQPDGTPLDPVTDSVSVGVTPTPGIEAVKVITSNTVVVEDTVTFRIDITNTGNVTLTGITVDDTLTRADGTALALNNLPAFASATDGSPAGTLIPDETASFVASYTLTQADVDAGGLSNTVTVTGTPPFGTAVSDVSDDGLPGGDDDPTVLTIPAAPALGLVKALEAVVRADGTTASSYSEVGDRLDYTFTVTNLGNVTITDPVSITDPLITDAGGTITCEPVPLAPGAQLQCVGSYSILQSDIDNAGEVNNTASATDGTTTSPEDSVLVQGIQTPGLATTKTARPLPPAQFVTGATATYDYVTTNTGNTTITTPITINDNLIDGGDITCEPFSGALLPGETFACVGTYSVTAEDVDLGVVTNLASGTDGTTTSPQVAETIPDNAVPALSIVKSSPDLAAGIDTVGQILTYNFEVTNTGERAFARAVTVSDDRIGTIDCFVPSAADPDFTAGEVANCSAPYTVTQADLDAGFVINEAFAQTLFGQGTNVVSAPDTVTIDVNRAPAIETTKTATLPAGRTSETLIAGDVLSYVISVRNSGNLTINNLTVSDPLLTLTCSVATLAPGVTDDSCRGDYVLLQSDIDAGAVTNTASATGSDPQGGTVFDDATLVTPLPTPAPELVVRKAASVAAFGEAGSVFSYTFEIENAGNVTLRNIVLTDAERLPGFSCGVTRLLPGEVNTECSAPYVVTQADVDAGFITNTATATGAGPDGAPVSGSGAVATPGPEANGQLEATKILDFDGTVAGSTVTYTVSVANTGNVTLANVVPVDTLTRLNGDPLALNAPGLVFIGGDSDGDDALDTTEVWQFRGSYTLTQDDINVGGLVNVVEVSATQPDGITVRDIADDGIDNDGNTQDDPTVFEIPFGAILSAIKTVNTPAAIAGETVLFDITVRNLGNVDIQEVTVDDTLSRADGTPIVTTAVPQFISGDSNDDGILNLSETFLFQLAYTLTQDDVDAGGVNNVAIARGADISGVPLFDVADDNLDSDGNTLDDPTQLVIPPAPALEVLKSVATPAAEVGETAIFEIVLRNTGNVTLRDAQVTDTLTRLDDTALTPTTPPTVSAVSTGSSAAAILPGGTVTYTVTYTITQEDIDAGGIQNTATAAVTTPAGRVVTDISDDPNAPGVGPSDPTILAIERLPSLAVTKSAVSSRQLFPTVIEVGFEITVENDGNTVLRDLQVRDDLATFAAPAEILNSQFPTTLSVTGLTSGAANPGFDGVSDTAMLAAGATLERGETATFTIVTTYVAAAGFPAPGENTASATSDELPAPITGVTVATVIDSDGDGVPDGVESLTADRDGDGIPDAQDFDPTGYFYCEDSGRILSGGLITVTGNGVSQTGVGTTGPIRILRDGSDGSYQFFVTQAGSYTLSYSPPSEEESETLRVTTAPQDVTNLRDVQTGSTTSNPRVLGSSEFADRGALSDFSPAANPAFYTTFVFEAGDPVVFSNNIPFQCTSIGDLTASKSVIGQSDVRLGDAVSYQLTYELAGSAADLRDLTFTDILPVGLSYVPGSARISRDGAGAVPLEPTRAGRSLTWPNEMMTAGSRTIITYATRVGPNAPVGELVNRTFARGPTGENLSNTAEAVVRRVPEHVFDCSDVIGTVFNDLNRNGYQDGPNGAPITDQTFTGGKGKLAVAPPPTGGEPGLPGVRLATVNGLLITTDNHGRFHVPCAELPSNIGTNFLLKVDERSLPSGFRITTENPRVVRLTAGKFAKMNFGAAIGRVIDINLSGNAFDSGAAPSAKLQQAVRNLAKTLRSEPSVVRLAYVANTNQEVKLGRARMRAVEKMLRKEWRRTGTYKLTIEKTIKRQR